MLYYSGYTRQGNVREIKFFQGQGIVREFYDLSGNNKMLSDIREMSGNFTFQSSKSLDVWSGCCFLVLFCSALCVGTLYNAVVIYWDREWRVGETFLYAEHTMKNLLEQENTCSSDSDQAGN